MRLLHIFTRIKNIFTHASFNISITLQAINWVEITSFDLYVCRELQKMFPNTTVYYLKGGMAPADVMKLGINGLNNNIKEMRDNPQWVDEAHKNTSTKKQ